MALQRRVDGGYRVDGPARDDSSPDVVLDVPRVTVEEIALEVESLHAHIALDARLAGLVHVHVGADADVSSVALELRGVEAEAYLRARLDNVVEILTRALSTVEQHPEVLVEAAQAIAGVEVKAIPDAAPADNGGGAATARLPDREAS